jgi:hypothetical protein
MQTLRPGIALVLAALLVGAVVACTSDEPRAATSPTSASSASPTPLASPAPSASPVPRATTPVQSPTPDLERSRAVVDEVIAAVASGDVNTLEALVRYREVPCDGLKDEFGPPFPACEGAELGTPVPAFAAGVCNVVWHRDPRPMLERFVERAGPLFAVLEGPRPSWEYTVWPDIATPDWDYRVEFVSSPVGQKVAAVAVIEDGQLGMLVLGCNPPGIMAALDDPPAVVMRGEAFVEPTPRPEATSTPAEDVTAPRGDRTGLPEIDAVIAAVETGNTAAIRALMRTTPQTCTFGSGLGGAHCEPNEFEGDIVETFSWSSCEGGWFRLDLDKEAESIRCSAVELFAVSAPGQEGGRWAVAYSNGSGGGRVLRIDHGFITGISVLGCSTPEEWAKAHEIVLRGPAWPAEDN